MGFMFCDLHVSLNNPSSGDISSSNLPCFSYFSTKTYVVGTQKNRLNETVLLST